jgi:hypothetical protein
VTPAAAEAPEAPVASPAPSQPRTPGGSGPTTLGEAARYFWSRPTPRVITAYLLVFTAVRVALGGWHPGELIVPAVVLALEPFTEWVIHVVVLHWRPRTLAGHTIDLYAGREHRRHHADPRNLDQAFVPVRLLLIQVPVLLLIGVFALPTPRLGLTLAISAMAMLLAYEWVHFLVHSPYQPRSRWYRYTWRAHRLHHFRNEHYWFGVTIHLADHVLRTFPEKSEVPVSGTARTLGVEADG